MRRESHARIYAVLGIGLVVAAILTMFMRVTMGLHTGAAGGSRVHDLIWMAAPLGLYFIAAMASVSLAWIPALRLARASAAASLIWPVCVIIAVLAGVHFLVPVILSSVVLGLIVYATRNFR